jgi:hypothetical protein
VVFEQLRLGEAVGGRGGLGDHAALVHHLRRRRRRPVDLTGDQFQLRLREAAAGLVDDRDPRREVHLARVAGLVEHDVVVGPPGHALGLIRDLRFLVAALRALGQPDQRRARDQAAGQRREAHAVVAIQRNHFAGVGLHQHRALGAEQATF